MNQDCIFCKIVAGEVPSKKAYEDSDTLAFYDIKPAAETHLVIIPKKHISTFMDLNNESQNLIRTAQIVINEKNIASGYKIVINGGKYQEVPHFHLHLLAGKLEKP
ncbi:MAG TPA: HIT domain-containing protein [Patescibacteria group bacterium]|nr:HIT domain-containing protein [Patescibacteria group bacterium]